MEVLTSDEIRERRNYFITESNRKTTVYRGDKRVNGGRFCAICKNPLSKVVLTSGTAYAARDHYHCYFSELFYVNICKDSRVCQKVHERLREEN